MKLLSLLSVLLLGLLAASAQANILCLDCNQDGDTAINCIGHSDWSGQAGTVNITGNQCSGPGHMMGTVTTDTPDDPHLGFSSFITNDTGAAWTSFQVNVYMNNSFALFAPQVYAPSGWYVAGTVADTPGSYSVDLNGTLDTYTDKATITFTGDTPIAVGDEIDFFYGLQFSGATSYAFTQEMIPVEAPEPATLGLLGLGLVGLVARRIRRK